MTKEELTNFFVASLEAQQKAHLTVVALIEKSVMAEREACAELCERASELSGAELAKKIRGRR